MQIDDSVIPAIDSAALPPEVRNGTPQDRELYSVALGFERMLVEQLTQQITDSSSLSSSDDDDGSDSDSDDSTDSIDSGSADLFAQQLPGAFADAITNGGGLGLAAQLYQAMNPTPSTTSSAPADASTPPDASVAPASSTSDAGDSA